MYNDDDVLGANLIDSGEFADEDDLSDPDHEFGDEEEAVEPESI